LVITVQGKEEEEEEEEEEEFLKTREVVAHLVSEDCMLSSCTRC
jgi:hypothetical protein